MWAGSVDDPRLTRPEVLQLLSSEERQRAERLVNVAQRQWFLAWRVLLRTILGRITGIPAAEVKFCRGQHGQPHLDAAQNQEGVRFSGSHSHSHVLLGVTRQREIGVDLERLRVLSDLEGLAERCLSPGERAQLSQFPAAQRNGAFFSYWTCKEAVLKGTGTGLMVSPDAVHVQWDGSCFRVARAPARAPQPGLTIEDFAAVGMCPFDGYVGAVAWTGPEPAFTAYSLPAI